MKENKDDLIYSVPPDIYHYENIIFLGFTDKEILLIAGVAVIFSLIFGLFGFIFGALLALVLVKRLDALSNRSIISYWIGKITVESRNKVIELPKILPQPRSSIELMTWNFKPIIGIESIEETSEQ